MCNFKRALAASVVFVSLSVFAKEVIHHPAPKKPIYVETNLYDILKKQLPTPPAVGSKEQAADEKEILKLTKERTDEQCKQAKIEAPVSLDNFYGPATTKIKAEHIKILSPFFEQTRNDADFFIQQMKIDFPRKRPFLYMKEVKPCVPEEVTGAYPSGHATLSKLWALILTDFYPTESKTFEARAEDIGKHRILSGMHHPSDIKAGRQLAQLIYNELKKSKTYEAAFKDVQAKIK